MIWTIVAVAGAGMIVFVLMLARTQPETPLEEQARCLKIQAEEKAEKRRRKAEKRRRRRGNGEAER